jgi:hypothetical protein
VLGGGRGVGAGTCATVLRKSAAECEMSSGAQSLEEFQVHITPSTISPQIRIFWDSIFKILIELY